jgi:hypothetical protein
MLLKRATLDGIMSGAITLQFRRWRRPTVKSGGTLLTQIGVLAIEDVAVVLRRKITSTDARSAGFPTLQALLAALDAVEVGDIYRVRLSYLGADPRVALRNEQPDDVELDRILGRLEAFDARSPQGPWTETTLRVIAARPQELAAHLATEVGMERAHFKTRVRKLKALGLTESLDIGYRLSPRGEAVLGRLASRTEPARRRS